MKLFRAFNKKPKPEPDKRQEEQKLFRWCLSQEKRRTNVPDEEVDKWFEREDDWRHLEDYGICTEDLEDYGESFNPYMILYDEVFGRNFHKDGVEKQEQNRRFLARCREQGISDIEKQKAYGAKLERVRFKKELKQEFLRVAAVLLIMVLAGCSVADYFGFGRHKVESLKQSFGSGLSCFIREKIFTLEVTILSNSENRQMMYMSYRRSSNIFDTLYIDSARIINGKATFKGKIPYSVQAFLSTEPKHTIGATYKHTSVAYLEPNKTVKCEIDLANPYDGTVINDSSVNADWKKFADIETAYFKEAGIRTRGNTNTMLNTVFDSLPVNSPVSLDVLIRLALNSIDNLDYVKHHFSQMPWTAQLSPEGLRLGKIISRMEDTGKEIPYFPEFSFFDKDGNKVEGSSLVGKTEEDRKTVIFYFWVPGGEYTRFGDYQKNDFEKLEELYKSSPQGSVRIVTVCATDNSDKLTDWLKIIDKYEEKGGWTNLRYYINPKTLKKDNVYEELYLEGKLPVSVVFNLWAYDVGHFEGELSYKTNAEMLRYIKWFNKYCK